jgi:hypothetical protein
MIFYIEIPRKYIELRDICSDWTQDLYYTKMSIL